jgi:hypothetical protein
MIMATLRGPIRPEEVSAADLQMRVRQKNQTGSNV